MESATTVHPFTRAGLGLAPFRYLGPEEQDRRFGEVILNRAEYERTGIAMTTKPGGTCAYCGTFIVNMFKVASADGRKFHVGSDCIKKVFPKDHPIARKVRKVISDRTKARTRARNVAQVEETANLLTRGDVRAVLAAFPHPSLALAGQGETLLGWAEYVMKRGGTTGRVKVARAIAARMKATK